MAQHTPYTPAADDPYVTRTYLQLLTDRSRHALAAAPRGSYLSHHTAAALHGLWPPPSAAIHISVPPRASRTLPAGTRAHRGHPHAWITHRGDLPLAAPPQTVVDLARSLHLIDLLPLVDSLLRRGPYDLHDIRSCARAQSLHRHTLTTALTWARPDVGSAMESRLRLLILMAGFPEPARQIPAPIPRHRLRPHLAGGVPLPATWTRTDSKDATGTTCTAETMDATGTAGVAGLAGEVTFAIDLSWEHLRVGAEYDGRHHESPEQRALDLVRRDALTRAGWHLQVATARDLMNHPTAILTPLLAAYNSRATTPLAISSTWRGTFVDWARPQTA